LRRAPAPALLVAALLTLPACGPKAITVGSRPFPAARPVFTDLSGTARADLPEAREPARLVLLDFPWCPACADAWKALRAASAQLPPGSARVYRVLFDRETGFTSEGKREAAPLRSPSLAESENPVSAGGIAVTSLTALPGPFGEEFRATQVPVLLLLEPDGTVARRWIGYSSGMAAEVATEVRKRARPPSPLPPGK